jgi:hypothetical protein
MGANLIAHALGGCKSGRGWAARCPTHDDCTPTLSISEADDGKVLVRCHTARAKLRLSGNGPPPCELGRRVVCRRKDLQAWFESRVARNTTDADARVPKRHTGQLWG